MLGGLIANSVNTVVNTPYSRTETFENSHGIDAAPGRFLLVSFLTVFIILLLILFFGKFLWNNVLVDLVPSIKPAKSVWQILGLAILLALLSPGNCSCDMPK